MGLAEALAANAPKTRKNRIIEILGNLNDSDRLALQEALQPDSGASSAGIARALRSKGHSIGESSVKRYRDRLAEESNA